MISNEVIIKFRKEVFFFFSEREDLLIVFLSSYGIRELSGFMDFFTLVPVATALIGKQSEMH